MVETALLTSGQGALARVCYETLRTHSDLKGVIFSTRSRRVSRWQRIKEYGSWYTGQFLVSQLLGRAMGLYVDPRSVGLDGVAQAAWSRAADQQEVAATLERIGANVLFVCSFQHILRPAFFERFHHVINVHPSLLPAYRGPEPILWGLLDGEQQFGVTLHHVDAGIDTGDIIAQAAVSRPWLPLALLVERRLAPETAVLMRRVLAQIETNNLVARPQPKDGAYLSAPTLVNRARRRKS